MNTTRKTWLLLSLSALMTANLYAQRTPYLKDAFKGKFSIGAAISAKQVVSKDKKLQNIVKKEFDCLVAENCMKGEVVSPAEGKWDFTDADRFVDYCEKNRKDCYGHCLVWHSQAPLWTFKGPDGQTVTRDLLLKRMTDHIRKVVTRYKGRVKAWDVVNEAIESDGSFRKSYYYNIIGEEFFEIAFKTAHECDPDAMLFYNDYNVEIPAKREATIALVKKLRAKGCRVDGVGIQSHVSLDMPLDEYERTIQALDDAGCKVMITELDLSVLPWPGGNNGAAVETNFAYTDALDPYKNGLPKEKADEFNRFYEALFAIYLRHADAITRVNFWGIGDADSWRNGWPVAGRTDYPLPFDRQLNPKGFVPVIAKMAVQQK